MNKTKAKPYCSCYEASGKRGNTHEKQGVTKCSDGETCDYCYHYVTWVIEELPKRHLAFDKYKHWEDYEDMEL